MDFRKVIYENVEKKTFISQQTYLYIQSQTFWSFVKFYFADVVKVCFVFKKQSLSLYSPYMHKVLQTLGNEKEQ